MAGGGSLRLLDDNPTTEDQLEFRARADLLLDVITGAQKRPLTVGILGSWGSGKTSLMEMVDARLESPVKTVWFNAWKYDRKEVVWNALIQTIFYEMKKDPQGARFARRYAFKRKVAHASRELAKYSAKIGTRLIPGGIVREGDIDTVLNALGSSANDELFEFIRTFEKTYDELVDGYIGDDGYLVVFIDDLDRCLPENAIGVLEALKLYLDRGNCVYVLGVEREAVEAAIRVRYGGSTAISASDYLEKIIQVPIVLPRARTQPLLALVEGQLPQQEQERRVGKLLRSGTNRNPRRVKRFLNAFMMACEEAKSRADGKELLLEQKLTLAKVLLIQMRFPDFHRALLQDTDLITKVTNRDASVWAEAGVANLRDDPALRHFLVETREIASKASDVRPWIRATVRTGSPGDLEEDDDLSARI